MPTVPGTEGNDLLIGSIGPDDIFGLGGNDTIEGRAGADIIDAGSGDDVISGEGDADIMTGGTGVDRFRDTAAGLNGDRITDLLPGDRIQLTDLTLQNANIGISGSTITFNGGSVTVDNLGPGRLIIRGIQSGGVEVRLQGIANNDFDGDGRSDVLWHSNTGRVTNWLGQLNGGFVGNFTFADGQAGIDWHIVGTGDFNGDGRSDVLWRNDDGSVTDWLGQANGGFTSNFANAFGQVDNSWQIAGTGDFNGDGRDDVLWHSNTGRVTNWLGQSHGGIPRQFRERRRTSWNRLAYRGNRRLQRRRT